MRQDSDRTGPPETDPEAYNVAPPDMPPSPAGADAERGGEAAASRRLAGQPAGRPPPPDALAPEPFLGYDALGTDDLLAWLMDADPEPDLLRDVRRYERSNRRRRPVLDEVEARLHRLGFTP